MDGKISNCPNCGKEILEGQDFCQGCGTNLLADMGKASSGEGKQRNSKHKGLITLLVIVLVVVAGYFGYSSYQKQQIKEYLTEAHTYMTEVNNTIQDLSFVNDAWDIAEDGSWLYYGTVKTYARNMFSTQISNAENAFESIESIYKSLTEKVGTIDQMQEMEKKIEDVHLAYETAYSMIILFEYGGNFSEITKLRTEISELKTMINQMDDEFGIVVGREDGVKVAN